MLRIFAAAVLCAAASPAFAFFQGPWNEYAQRPAPTIQGYAKASSSRSCLTSDTRAVLARLEARVGSVSIVSTCRPGATIAGTRRPSFHRYGKAVDFNTRNKAAAIAFLRTQPVFVMTYANYSHIHFNTGQKGIALGAGGGVKKWRKR